MLEGKWVKCPTCGWHWKIFHTGAHAIEEGELKPGKGEFTFDKGNLDVDAFISVRQLPGGRGNPESFREIEKITLEQARSQPEYANQIESLKRKIQKILQILGD